MEDPEDPYMKKWDPKTPKTPKGKKSGKGSAKAAAPKEPGVGSKSIESHKYVGQKVACKSIEIIKSFL